MSRDPTFAQLRAFIAVARELHFVRAAKSLHTSQPPLTRSIQALESSLGLKLFERDSRNVSLTAEGSAILSEAEHLVRRADRLLEQAGALERGQNRRLSVACVEQASYNLVPRAIAGFRQLHPDVDLELTDMYTQYQIQQLRDLHIDIGVLRLPVDAPELDFELICHDFLVAAIPEGHPLAVDEIRLEQLEDESIITYAPEIDHSISPSFMSACNNAGFQPNIQHRVRSNIALFSLVAAGEGIGIVSAPIAQIPRTGIVFAPFIGQPLRSTIAVAWRKGEETSEIADFRAALLRETL